LQLVSHLTDYLLHEKFQSGFRPGPGPEPSVNRVFYNLLIVIQKPIKPGLYLAFGTVGQWTLDHLQHLMKLSAWKLTQGRPRFSKM